MGLLVIVVGGTLLAAYLTLNAWVRIWIHDGWLPATLWVGGFWGLTYLGCVA